MKRDEYLKKAKKTVNKYETNNNSNKMKNLSIKALIIAVAMIGNIQAQAAEKTFTVKVKEAVKSINKEINKDHAVKPRDGFSGGAVRG